MHKHDLGIYTFDGYAKSGEGYLRNYFRITISKCSVIMQINNVTSIYHSLFPAKHICLLLSSYARSPLRSTSYFYALLIPRLAFSLSFSGFNIKLEDEVVGRFKLLVLLILLPLFLRLLSISPFALILFLLLAVVAVFGVLGVIVVLKVVDVAGVRRGLVVSGGRGGGGSLLLATSSRVPSSASP